MRIHLSDPHLVPNLLAFLRERVHVVADQVGPQEVEVSQLGSRNAVERRLELDLLLQLWRTSHTCVETRILEAPPEKLSPEELSPVELDSPLR